MVKHSTDWEVLLRLSALRTLNPSLAPVLVVCPCTVQRAPLSPVLFLRQSQAESCPVGAGVSVELQPVPQKIALPGPGLGLTWERTAGHHVHPVCWALFVF